MATMQHVQSGDDANLGGEIAKQMAFVRKQGERGGQGITVGWRAAGAALSACEQEGTKRNRNCRDRKRFRKLLEGGCGDGERESHEGVHAREEVEAAESMRGRRGGTANRNGNGRKAAAHYDERNDHGDDAASPPRFRRLFDLI